jgi:hypothetical protein
MKKAQKNRRSDHPGIQSKGAGISLSQRPDFFRNSVLVSLILIAIILVVYAPVGHYGFLSWDDPPYVTKNSEVSQGLRWDGLVWAFTTGHSANWHPLTWLSHMLDVSLYGKSAGYHHLTSVLWHIANTLLLFWALFRMTGVWGPGVMVAALFAIHPIHAESVAWIAERKDVLSAQQYGYRFGKSGPVSGGNPSFQRSPASESHAGGRPVKSFHSVSGTGEKPSDS